MKQMFKGFKVVKTALLGCLLFFTFPEGKTQSATNLYKRVYVTDGTWTHTRQFQKINSLAECGAMTMANDERGYHYDQATKVCKLGPFPSGSTDTPGTGLISVYHKVEPPAPGVRDPTRDYPVLMGVCGHGNGGHALYTHVGGYDMTGQGLNCGLLVNPPSQTATRGGFFDGVPFICGGFPHYKNCYKYEAGGWHLTSALATQRSGGRDCAVLFDGSIWFTGGNGAEKTTEIFRPGNNFIPEPYLDLPIAMQAHRMVKVDDGDTIVFVCGQTAPDVYLFSVENEEFFHSPTELSIRRRQPTAGVVRSDSGGWKLVVAGGHAPGDVPQKTTEILDLTTFELTTGGDLPNVSAFIEGVPFGDTFLAVGGGYPTTNLIAEWDIATETWIPRAETFGVGNGAYLCSAFMVPDGIFNCT